MLQDDTLLISAARGGTESIASIYLDKVIRIRKLPRLLRWFKGASKHNVLINKQHHPWDFTALHEAVRMDRVQMVEMLLDAGADVSPTDVWGRTPMHYATTVDTVNILLAHGACLNALDNINQTVLHFAVQKCDNMLSCFLIQHGADPSDVNMNTQDEHGETPLHFAVTHGLVEVARCLLQNRAHINIHNAVGMSPIHTSITQGIPEMIRLLFRYGANIEQLGVGGSTPLFFAIILGLEDIARMLIDEYRADVTITLFDNSHATLLHITAHTASLWAVDLLVAHGVDVNKTDLHGNTPLHYAIEHDHVGMVVNLLKRGAKLWSKRPTGELYQVINIHDMRNGSTSTTMSLIRHVYQCIEEASNTMELKKNVFTLFERIEPSLIDLILQDPVLDTSRDKMDIRNIIEEIERRTITHQKTVLDRFSRHRTIVGAMEI